MSKLYIGLGIISAFFISLFGYTYYNYTMYIKEQDKKKKTNALNPPADVTQFLGSQDTYVVTQADLAEFMSLYDNLPMVELSQGIQFPQYDRNASVQGKLVGLASAVFAVGLQLAKRATNIEKINNMAISFNKEIATYPMVQNVGVGGTCWLPQSQWNNQRDEYQNTQRATNTELATYLIDITERTNAFSELIDELKSDSVKAFIVTESTFLAAVTWINTLPPNDPRRNLSNNGQMVGAYILGS